MFDMIKVKNLLVVLAASISILFFTGCGGNKSEEMADTTGVYGLGESAPVTSQDIPFSTTNLPSDRKFVKTAELKFKVMNVLDATQTVEQLTTKFGGYTINSEVQNFEENTKNVNYSSDSLLKLSQIVVSNKLVVKVPSQQLDSFLLALRPLFLFLDYRTINLEDVTRRTDANASISQSYNEATPRIEAQIKDREGKVNQGVDAEQKLLDNKIAAAEAEAQRKQLEDDLKYSTVTIHIYQSPIVVKEILPNFDKLAHDEQGFFSRFADSISEGWYLVKEFILVITKLWGIVLFIIVAIVLFKISRKWYKEWVKYPKQKD